MKTGRRIHEIDSAARERIQDVSWALRRYQVLGQFGRRFLVLYETRNSIWETVDALTQSRSGRDA